MTRPDDHLPLERDDRFRHGDPAGFEMPSRASYELDHALTSLPHRYRLVMHLRWREGMTYADIADVTGSSINGVENQLSRGLRELRRALGDSGEGLDWQLLDRFLIGEASAAEVDRVHTWMDGAAKRGAMLEALRRDTASPTHVDVDSARRRFAGRTVRRSTRSNTELLRSAAWLTAAVLVLAVGLTISLWMLRDSGATRQLATAWRETTAPLGRRVTITLPDSSRVVLNAGSTLRYPFPFESSKREVVLHGEGYFAAQHEPTRPFHVRANNVDVEDLGTRFVVSAYNSSFATQVVAVEGAVAVTVAGKPGRDTVVIKPGAIARVAPDGAISTGTVDPERFTGFANGMLVLADLTLADAIPIVERWYDVRIRLTDSSLRQRALTTNFRDERLAGVLDALSLALNVDIKRDGRDVTISPRPRR